MALLNLRQSPPSESPGGETPATEEVASVREMLDSGEPPGLDRIRRFVLKPRPRLWGFGVGVWLWLARIGQWCVRFLKWIGDLAARVARGARVASFLGRRAQNLGARVGAVGRNWSSAHGRLGAAGGRLTRLGAWLIEGGATLAQVGDGVTELTKRAARFRAEAPDSDSESRNPEKTPTTGSPPAPPPKRRKRRTTAPAPGQPATRSGPSSSRAADESPAAAQAPAGGAVSAEPPPRQQPPEPAAADPPSLPDDMPFYLRNQIEHLGKRPRRETVERLILALTEARGWTQPGELAQWLGTTAQYLVRRYLGPMTEAGHLVRHYPNRPTHPDQAYRSARGGTAPGTEPVGDRSGASVSDEK